MWRCQLLVCSAILALLVAQAVAGDSNVSEPRTRREASPAHSRFAESRARTFARGDDYDIDDDGFRHSDFELKDIDRGGNIAHERGEVIHISHGHGGGYGHGKYGGGYGGGVGGGYGGGGLLGHQGILELYPLLTGLIIGGLLGYILSRISALNDMANNGNGGGDDDQGGKDGGNRQRFRALRDTRDTRFGRMDPRNIASTMAFLQQFLDTADGTYGPADADKHFTEDAAEESA